MSSLDESWFDLWRSLRAARRRRDVERAVALGGEIIRLAALLRAHYRWWQRRQRGARSFRIGSSC
jgi:hypothetical protein